MGNSSFYAFVSSLYMIKAENSQNLMPFSVLGNSRYHSAFGVLKYSNPKEIFIGSIFLCETDFWVPPMFALVRISVSLMYGPPASVNKISFPCRLR